MPYGYAAKTMQVGNRPHLRFVRQVFAAVIGDIEPHSHVRWAAICPVLTAVRRRLGTIERVLEVGTGAGVMTLELHRVLKPQLMVGFDLVTPTLSKCVAECFRADATKIPLSSSSQDLVTAFDIIEHIDADGDALREMYRILKPGGYLLLTVPTPEYPRWFGRTFHEALGHVRDGYTSEDLITALTGAGFTPLLIRPHTGIIFLAFAYVYYRVLMNNLYASAIATAAVKPLVAVDRLLPSPIWGALVACARKPEDELLHPSQVSTSRSTALG